MQKVLVTGEGKTDYGCKDYASGNWNWGPIYCYIQNCLSEEQKQRLQFEAVEREDVDRIRLQRSAKHLRGKTIPSRKFKNYLMNKGYSYGIYYCDTDKVESGSNTDVSSNKKHFEKIYADVKMGLESDDNKIIPMIAMKMIESWMLADGNAYMKIYGTPVDLPNKPELIWGEKSDISSNYPKHVLKRVLESVNGYEIDLQSAYNEIAKNTDIEILQEKCPISFGKFKEDIGGI